MVELRLKFALIDCSYMGKGYIDILSQHPEREVAALIDTDCNRFPEYKNLDIPFFIRLKHFLIPLLKPM